MPVQYNPFHHIRWRTTHFKHRIQDAYFALKGIHHITFSIAPDEQAQMGLLDYLFILPLIPWHQTQLFIGRMIVASLLILPFCVLSAAVSGVMILITWLIGSSIANALASCLTALCLPAVSPVLMGVNWLLSLLTRYVLQSFIAPGVAGVLTVCLLPVIGAVHLVSKYMPHANRVEENRAVENRAEQAVPVRHNDSFSQRLENINFKYNESADQWCCPIFKYIMNDPVTLSSGVTYDRESLKELLRRSTTEPSFDPSLLTQCAVTRKKLFPSLNLGYVQSLGTTVLIKKEIETFVAEAERVYHLSKIEEQRSRQSQASKPTTPLTQSNLSLFQAPPPQKPPASSSRVLLPANSPLWQHDKSIKKEHDTLKQTPPTGPK